MALGPCASVFVRVYAVDVGLAIAVATRQFGTSSNPFREDAMLRGRSLGALVITFVLGIAGRAGAQRGQAQLAGGDVDPGNGRAWDVTLARGKTREIDF